MLEPWPEHWLPFSKAANGDILCMDSAAESRVGRASVTIFYADQEIVWSSRGSMAGMVTSWLSCIEQGIWRYDTGAGAWWQAPYNQIPAEVSANPFV